MVILSWKRAILTLLGALDDEGAIASPLSFLKQDALESDEYTCRSLWDSQRTLSNITRGILNLKLSESSYRILSIGSMPAIHIASFLSRSVCVLRTCK